MSYLTQWSFDPWVIVIAVAVVWDDLGLARLARRSGPARTSDRRRRALLFGALVSTDIVMFILAMALSIFSLLDRLFLHRSLQSPVGEVPRA